MMNLFLTSLLLLVGTGGVPRVCASDKVANRIHGDSIWDTKSIMDEETRRRIFMERHGSWPDPKWLERETPGYTKRMAERTQEVMRQTDSQQRWDQWMFLAQARVMPSFTPRQWDVVRMPEEVHSKLYTRFHQMLPGAILESMGPELSGVEGPKRSLFFPQEELNYEVLHELKPMFEEWAGTELEPTSVYGVRVYQNGSTLRDHLDVLETHVISGILHIDSDLNAPFPIQIEDSSGALASLNLKPGEMMFYESAKCFHQRSIPMNGRYYASIFMHYRPVGWNVTRDDARLAIPPNWADGLDTRGGGVVYEPRPRYEERPIGVEFVNNSPELVRIMWSQPQDHVESEVGTVEPGASAVIESFVGHHFVARDASGKTLNHWELTPSEQSPVRIMVRDKKDEL